MKRQVLSWLAIIAILSLTHCSKKDSSPSNPAPAANFTYSGAGLAPATVTFTNSSMNATSYSWDFGDNATSTANSPTHTYNQGGVYTVKLTATGSGGSNSTTKTVNIQTPTSVKLVNLKIVSISLIDPSCNCSWDIGSGPDVFFNLLDPSNAIVVTGGVFNDVATTSFPLSWNFSPVYQITNLASLYTFQILDHDTADPDDLMASFTFNPSIAAAAGYPTIINGTVGTTQIQLTVQWQ